ncbi:MAG: NADH-quinone oxidoreductase subunit J [Proteobacteria bacterium]|nr:NADH-quinone oxidoreductase subunit J [Pseudomonadota bacterium]
MMILFYIAATVAVVSTVGVIVQSNIVHALIYLILSLLAVAVVFFSLGAPFVAVLEAIVYAGAIMVLFLFVIMMLNLGQHSIDQEKTWMAAKDWALPAGLAAILLAQLLYVLRDFQVDIVPNEVGVLEVSALLFGPYVLAVELASILLLAGLVSAYHLAKK